MAWRLGRLENMLHYYQEPIDKLLAGEAAVYETYNMLSYRCGLIRNTLALISSEDLYHWRVERTVLASDNPFFDGFQYVDWQFDGDDLIAVIRLAVEEPRGLPNRQHDANFLVFKRIERFREPGAAAPDNVRTLHKP